MVLDWEGLLVSHGFPAEAAGHIKPDDRQAVVRSRRTELIRGEREFMRSRGVTLPAVDTGDVVADSDVSEDDGVETSAPDD